MNSHQPETKMTSNVVFSLMYSVPSIIESCWGGSSLVAGLAATTMAVVSFDAAGASFSLKIRLAHSQKISMAEG